MKTFVRQIQVNRLVFAMALCWCLSGCGREQDYQGQQLAFQNPAAPAVYPTQPNQYAQPQVAASVQPLQGQAAPAVQPSLETGYIQVEQPQVAMPIYSIEGPPANYLGVKDLGKLFDADFNLLPVPNPFTGAKVSTVASSKASHAVMLVENSNDFNLHVGLLGILNAKYKKNMKTRLAIARNVMEKRYHELEVAQAPTALPSNAVYFLWRVTEGHLYEYAMVGSNKVIGKDFGVSLKKYTTLKPEADIGTLKNDSSLKVEAVMKGMIAVKGDSLFCHPDDISKCYTTNGAAAEPIALTYRLLPGKNPPEGSKIRFGAKSFLPDERRLTVVSATILPKKNGGQSWDGDKSAADPFVVISVGSGDNRREIFRSQHIPNMLNPTWSQSKPCTLGPNDHLTVRVYDKDLLDHDFIGECTTRKLAEEILADGHLRLKDCGQATEVLLKVD